jgi:hypothetical protein
MSKHKEITVTSIVIRHNPQFSRLVTIALDKLVHWKLTGTMTIEGTINDTALGRRSLKWWEERRCWWIDLPEVLCKKAKLETGDEVQLTIRLASEDLPDELTDLLKNNSAAKANWEKLTQPQQRMLREDVFAAKSSATRKRRAERLLI